MSVTMRRAAERLYDEAQIARAGRAGAEQVLRAVNEEMRAIRRDRIAHGLTGELPELDMALARVKRAVQRTVNTLVGEEHEALESARKAPTLDGLTPVEV